MIHFWRCKMKNTTKLPIKELSETFLFRNVDIKTLDEKCPFLGECVLQDYPAGAILHSASSPLAGLAFFCSGTADVLSDASDKGVLLRTISRGDFLGVSTVYTDSRGYNTAVRARTDCSVFLIPVDNLKRIIACDANVSENYIRFLTERICFLNRKISAFTAGSADAKLTVYLLGLPQNENGVITLPCSLSGLAEMLNMGRASLYRAFDSLCACGAISRNGKTIQILDKKILSTTF